jgi:hypothetical protein
MSLDSEEWLPVEIGRPDSVTWSASVACTACVPDTLDETLEVFIRAHDGTPTADGEGHVNGPAESVDVLSFEVIFDVAPPEHVSSVVSGGHDTFEPGETVTITTVWNDTGYTVEADFSRVDSEYDPEDVEVTETSPGRYSASYELSQANSLVPVLDAPIIVTVTDAYSRSASDSTLAVSVLPAASEGPSALGVDVNSFMPPLGEKVVVSFGSYDGVATVSVYNMAGTLVRTIESQGVSSVNWYGYNDEGESVASGVYFLWIQTDESEAVRKVAVIR